MTPEKAVSQADSPRKRSRGRPTCDCAHGADALLLNARRIFAQRGFYASSVRQIAEASGVDAALISHHFGSKEALWIAVVDQIATLTQSLIEQTHLLRQSEMAPAERLEQAVREFVEAVFENPDVGMFFSTAATEEGERLDIITQRLVRPYRDAMVPLVSDWLVTQHRPVAEADHVDDVARIDRLRSRDANVGSPERANEVAENFGHVTLPPAPSSSAR